LKKDAMNEARQLLHQRLHSAAALLTEDMRSVDLNDGSVLRRFGAAVEGNFLQWLRGAEAACVNDAAKAIIARNIRTEVLEDHPGLLHEILEYRHCLPGDVDFSDVDAAVYAIRCQCIDRDAISLLSTISLLESTAYIFLPIVDRICSTEQNTTAFVARHLDVDVTHSEEIKVALEMEWPAHPHQMVALGRGIDTAMSLLRAVFVHTEARG
jgi:hypothetical protein